MNDKLILVRKSAYATWASQDERGPATMHGIYQTHSAAIEKSKGIGWYGGNGEVRNQEVWVDEITGLVYLANKCGDGLFDDDPDAGKTRRLANIRSKIGDDDLKFLFENVSYEQVLHQKITERK